MRRLFRWWRRSPAEREIIRRVKKAWLERAMLPAELGDYEIRHGRELWIPVRGRIVGRPGFLEWRSRDGRSCGLASPDNWRMPGGQQ